jgi:hypothetical protein
VEPAGAFLSGGSQNCGTAELRNCAPHIDSYRLAIYSSSVPISASKFP